VGVLRGDESFPTAARRALGDAQLRRNLATATGTIRGRRAAVVAELDDWEPLRAAGAAIKDDVLAHLDAYLVQLEENVTARGGIVHWARDAHDANRIVVDLVRAAGADEVVKVKSRATQEIGLNEALADAVSGGVARPGVVEVPVGATIGDIVGLAGGAVGKPAAVRVGGYGGA